MKVGKQVEMRFLVKSYVPTETADLNHQEYFSDSLKKQASKPYDSESIGLKLRSLFPH